MMDEIHTLLDALQLHHSRQIIADHIKSAQKSKPSYSAFLLQLLRHEFHDKRQRALARRLRRSGLTEFWTLDTFPFHIQKKINKKLLYEWAELDFVDRGESLVFIGPSGIGKTGLASALILKALYAGKRVCAIKAHDLFDEFSSSLADKSTRAITKRLSNVDLLLIDEFGYVTPPNPSQVNHFFRLLDIRCNRKSTLLTTNLGFDDWGSFLGNQPLVSALLGRLLQKCQVMAIDKGINLRSPQYKLPTAPTFPSVLKND